MALSNNIKLAQITSAALMTVALFGLGAALREVNGLSLKKVFTPTLASSEASSAEQSVNPKDEDRWFYHEGEWVKIGGKHLYGVGDEMYFAENLNIHATIVGLIHGRKSTDDSKSPLYFVSVRPASPYRSIQPEEVFQMKYFVEKGWRSVKDAGATDVHPDWIEAAEIQLSPRAGRLGVDLSSDGMEMIMLNRPPSDSAEAKVLRYGCNAWSSARLCKEFPLPSAKAAVKSLAVGAVVAGALAACVCVASGKGASLAEIMPQGSDKFRAAALSSIIAVHPFVPLQTSEIKKQLDATRSEIKKQPSLQEEELPLELKLD